jgi:hypothetical protein
LARTRRAALAAQPPKRRLRGAAAGREVHPHSSLQVDLTAS